MYVCLYVSVSCKTPCVYVCVSKIWYLRETGSKRRNFYVTTSFSKCHDFQSTDNDDFAIKHLIFFQGCKIAKSTSALWSLDTIAKSTSALCSLDTIAKSTSALCSLDTIAKSTSALCSLDTIAKSTSELCSRDQMVLPELWFKPQVCHSHFIPSHPKVHCL